MGTQTYPSAPSLAWARERGCFEAYGEWSWDVEWLLEEAASRAAQTSWARMGYRRATEARALILQWYRRRMGITVVRYGPAPLAPLAVRGAHASAVGALQAEGGSGAPEAGEGAGGAPFRGGSEDGAGALLPVASGVVRETW